MMALLAGLAATATGAAAGATTVEIQGYWLPEAHNEFSIHAAGRELCRFAGQAPADQPSVPATCRFELPAGVTDLEVRGRVATNVWIRRKDRVELRSAEGARTFRLRDVSALTRPLRATTLSWGERLRQSIAAERAFAPDDEPRLSVSAPAAAAEIAAAQQRLGFALPTGYLELVGQVGRVGLDEHWIPAPGELLTADRTLEQWGYRERGGAWPEWFPAAAVERLAKSVALFFEVGDGMGAQLVVVDGASGCGDRIATIFLHEESLADGLEALAAGRLECRSFDELFLELHARSVLMAYEWNLVSDEGGLPEVVFDASAPLEVLRLRYAVDERGRFEVNLSRD